MTTLKSLTGKSLNWLRNQHWLFKQPSRKFIKDKIPVFRKFFYSYREFTDFIAIETTTICNRRCPYCPHFWTDRPEKLMPEKLFFKIINDLSNLNYRGGITFSPWSEPLLDDRLLSFIQMAKQKLPNCRIHLNSNGDLLTADLFEKLVSAGVEEIDISDHFYINGNEYVSVFPNKSVETYDRLKENERQKLHFHGYNLARLKRQDLFHNRSGLIHLEDEISIKAYCDTCTFAESIMTITADGDVVLCARQWTKTPVFGNIMDLSIKAIWDDHEYKRLRQNLMEGRFDLDLCKKCGFGYLPDAKELSALKNNTMREK